MQPALKTRLIGAAVLVALAVIIVPLFFSGEPGGTGNQSISLDIPQSPDRELETRTMSVPPPPRAGEVGRAADTGDADTADGDQLARVDIPSRVPRDVGPGGSDAADGNAADEAVDDAPPADSRKPQADASADADTAKPDSPPADKPKASSGGAGQAAKGHFQVSLGAYASKANAEGLVQKVRKLGYPVALTAVKISGKPAARVDAGPFDTRAAAETARQKLHAALPRAPVRLVSGATDQTRDAAGPKADDTGKAKPRAGGWAVQLVAYSKQSDANALRDKLRGAGFDGYVDSVKSGGNSLWRVRVGPQTQRADAVSLQSRIKKKFPDLAGRVVSVP